MGSQQLVVNSLPLSKMPRWSSLPPTLQGLQLATDDCLAVPHSFKGMLLLAVVVVIQAG